MEKYLAPTDGKGQWENWGRSFETSMAAVLDLFDNTLDAVGGEESGKINLTLRQNEQDACEMSLTNTCTKEPKHLSQVLTIARSTKESHDIGENGVGLKQACAMLSTLSFVFSRDKDHNFALGILSKQMQRLDGVFLPHFQFQAGEFLLKDMLRTLAEVPDIRSVLQKYGNDDYDTGVKLLFHHYQSLCTDVWRDYDYVFSVLVSNPHDYASLRHSLREGLSRHYIHIPSRVEVTLRISMTTRWNRLDDRVARAQTETINFDYWPQRLVELTQCDLLIDASTPFQTVDKRKVVDAIGYPLRVFLGFDPTRLERSTTASLFIYSRRSGRLVVTEEDARILLSLTTGGTSFCQGLTILIDDYESMLPLDPTKQKVVFGNEGQVHRNNLFAWVGAVAQAYWSIHHQKFQPYTNQKELLTSAVAVYKQYNPVQKVAPQLDQGAWTQLRFLSWVLKSQTAGRPLIRISTQNGVQLISGHDTARKIYQRPVGSVSAIPRKTKVTTGKGTKPATSAADEYDDKDESTTLWTRRGVVTSGKRVPAEIGKSNTKKRRVEKSMKRDTVTGLETDVATNGVVDNDSKPWQVKCSQLEKELKKSREQKRSLFTKGQAERKGLEENAISLQKELTTVQEALGRSKKELDMLQMEMDRLEEQHRERLVTLKKENIELRAKLESRDRQILAFQAKLCIVQEI